MYILYVRFAVPARKICEVLYSTVALHDIDSSYLSTAFVELKHGLALIMVL